ncbi:unnamed protein product [Heterosigma akashiwo]|mmetsp:Transcript_13173/g.18346  ORF Transcript_13173/g.18346 Transcript_13173/m.18346 type:complete len:121 (-) Transcript_13173:257-619(-)
MTRKGFAKNFTAILALALVFFDQPLLSRAARYGKTKVVVVDPGSEYLFSFDLAKTEVLPSGHEEESRPSRAPRKIDEHLISYDMTSCCTSSPTKKTSKEVMVPRAASSSHFFRVCNTVFS